METREEGQDSSLPGPDTSLGNRPRILRRDQNTSLNNTSNLLDATRGELLGSRNVTRAASKSLLNISIGDEVIASPSPHESRRARQALPANISSTDMTHIRDHYMECIKLSTENKINSKNAFLLKLNSLTSAEALTTEGETDFKMAGMAVDASAKIYAGRVDSVHHDTYSVLGSLSSGKATEGGGEGDEGEEGEGEGTKSKKKSQKKKKLKNKYEKAENLNYKSLELAYYDDPILKRIAAASDENGIYGLLALQLPMEEKHFQLKLDMSQPYPPLPYKDPWCVGEYVAGVACVTQLFETLDSIDDSPAPTCALVDGFVFDAEGNYIRRPDVSRDEPTTNEVDLEVQDNLFSTSQHDSPNLQLDFSGLEESFHSPENTSVEEACAPMAPPSPMTSLNAVLQLIESSEYSYLSADTLRELQKKEERMGLVNNRAIKLLTQPNKGSNEKVKEKKRSVKLIDFSSQIPETAFQYPKSVKSHQNTDSSVETKAERKQFYRNYELSEPFDPKVLSSLFLLPSSLVGVQEPCSVERELESGGGDSSYYNYDAETDLTSYIPYINPAEGATGEEGEYAESVGASSNISLIAPPPRPEKILLSYDNRPRQVDMKGLKSRMWRLIEESSNREECDNENIGCVQFSQLTERLLPSTDTETRKEHTSKAILFSTLLHLANEHTLVLDQPDDTSDINIYQNASIVSE